MNIPQTVHRSGASESSTERHQYSSPKAGDQANIGSWRSGNTRTVGDGDMKHMDLLRGVDVLEHQGCGNINDSFVANDASRPFVSIACWLGFAESGVSEKSKPMIRLGGDLFPPIYGTVDVEKSDQLIYNVPKQIHLDRCVMRWTRLAILSAILG